MSKVKKPVLTESVGVDACKGQGCKKPQARCSFCDQHYEWFKFGLVNKEGKHVPDFDKKFDHRSMTVRIHTGLHQFSYFSLDPLS